MDDAADVELALVRHRLDELVEIRLHGGLSYPLEREYSDLVRREVNLLAHEEVRSDVPPSFRWQAG